MMNAWTIGAAAKVFGLFCLIHHTEGSQSCPTEGDTANCTYNHLSSVPTNLKASVKVLYLDRNGISTLISSNFASLPALTNLSATYSKIVTVDQDAFKGLRKLLSLDLRGNKIHSLTVFHVDLVSLTVLHLENNAIGKIQQDVFNSLTKLQELHLENNKLTRIHPHAFTKLMVVKWIGINNNILTAADDDWFRPVVKSITYISLEKNPWNCSNNMCDFKKWAQRVPKKISGMLNVFCKDANKTLKNVHTKNVCRNITLNVTPASTFNITCPEGKTTNWTLDGEPIRNGLKFKIMPGTLMVIGIKKHGGGHYCCRNPSKVDDSHCFIVKISTKSASSSSGGTTAAIIIIIIVAASVIGIWFFKRKRRNYGVLNDEPPLSYDESVGSTRSSHLNAEQIGVGEAYV